MSLSNVVVSQFSYIAIIILLCVVASTFYFLRPLKTIKQNITSEKYLSLFFLVFASAFTLFSVFSSNLHIFFVFANNTLFILSFIYLKAAFISRHSVVSENLWFNKSNVVMYLLALSVNMYLYSFVDNSQIARVIVLTSSVIIMLLTMFRHVVINPSRPSMGEKIALKGLKLSILILSVLIISVLAVSNPFYYISILTIALSTLVIIIFGSTLTMFLSEVADMYHQESMFDFLTGLLNRRQFFESSDQIVRLSNRQNFDISIIMGDIDDFKFINDIFGHDVGDRVIQNFASMIKKLTRDTDITARFGGEEFCLLLPYTNIEGAHELAERIRNAISQEILDSHICDVRYTASFGVSSFNPKESLNSAIIKADRALYSAKEQGKNQVIKYSKLLNLTS